MLKLGLYGYIVAHASLSLVIATTTESFSVSLDGTDTQLRLKDRIDPIEIIEHSYDLENWVSVARNYDGEWENTYPHTYPLSNVSGSTDKEMTVPTSESGFYRKRSATNVATATNKALAARFLMQATFGPTLSEIDDFEGVNSSTFGQPGDNSFETWIDQQIAIDPFYHRAYWRQRSDPEYTDRSAGKTYLDPEVNEVGHLASEDVQLAFNRGNTVYRTDWTSVLPGYGSVDTAGSTIYGYDYLDRPIKGKHADKAKINQDANGWSNAYDIVYPINDTRQIVWYQAAINAPDQLRQRVAWALSQYFVVAELGNNQPQAVERWLNYYDIFTRHAFGNFRDMLDEVTWSPHMGYYLSHMGNQKANTNKGTFPDENYAREVMQLFTIGLWELNEDGTLKMDGGEAIPTYDNNDIEEFAKVFTGMQREESRGGSTPNIEELGDGSTNYVDPMRVIPNRHDTTIKTLLDGSTLGPFGPSGIDLNGDGEINTGGEANSYTEQDVRNDVAGLLEHLFNHANMPPFFARFMIQRMTVSNPSPSYIYDVSQAFKDGLFQGSGSGQRGCMEAIVKAVLLHPEARSSNLAYDPNHGKLREPLIRLIHVARAFSITSNRTYGWLYFKDLEDKILQAPYEQTSVFNYYRPDYAPNGAIADSGLNAPEFQIHNDVSALHLANGLSTLIEHGIVGQNLMPYYGNIGQRNRIEAELDFTHEISIAGDTTALIDHLNLVLCAGRLSYENRATIETAIANANLSGEDKVKYIARLMVLTPEFNTLY